MSLVDLTDKELLEYHQLYEEGNAKSARFEIYKFNNFDTKYAYHLVRLFDEVEQIMLEGDLNLQRAKEVLKAIRRGDWTADEVRNWAIEKERVLEVAYTSCKLPERAPIEPLRQLLLNCLEEHYGSLNDCIEEIGWAEQTLKSMDNLLDQVRRRLYS